MMTKIAIFYFSGTGNTHWAANQLAERLQNCPVYSIEAPLDFTAIIDTLDQVVFAYPIYGSDLPLPMKQFLMRLPLGERTIKTYSIVTQWQFSGDGGVLIREFLPKRFALSGSAHIFMPNNISVTSFKAIFRYTNDPIKLKKVLDKAHKKISGFADDIKKDQTRIVADQPFSHMLGLMQRGPFRKYYDRFTDDIGFDAEACTNCGLCIRICPMKNLSEDEKTPKAAGKCALCLRCYNYCPVQAITYMGKKHDPRRGLPYRMPEMDFLGEVLKVISSSVKS